VREQVVQPIRASGVPADRRGSSFNHVTPVCAAGDLARGRAVEGAEALRRRTALHWGGWLIEVARRRGLPLADLRLYGIVPSMLNQSGDQKLNHIGRHCHERGARANAARRPKSCLLTNPNGCPPF
jgi:hypothetical protein